MITPFEKNVLSRWSFLRSTCDLIPFTSSVSGTFSYEDRWGSSHMLEQLEQKSTELSGGQSWQCHLTPWMGSMPQMSHCTKKKEQKNSTWDHSGVKQWKKRMKTAGYEFSLFALAVGVINNHWNDNNDKDFLVCSQQQSFQPRFVKTCHCQCTNPTGNESLVQEEKQRTVDLGLVLSAVQTGFG